MRAPSVPRFQAGDIMLFAGGNEIPSRVSRWVERARGEPPTYAVHAAQFLDANHALEMDGVTKIRPLAYFLGRRRGFEVWRRRGLTRRQRAALTREALRYLNARISVPKLFTHLLDGALSKLTRREVFLFRRLNHDQRYPICSWITAFAYDRALRYQFGVPPSCADPDQIEDWVGAHPREWTRVFVQPAPAPGRQGGAAGAFGVG
jgi:hypothetical protein